MYYNSYVDTFISVTEENKYGDKVTTLLFKERTPCVILEASYTAEISNNARIVKLIADDKITRDTIFKYDNDTFKVLKYRKAKQYYVMFAEMIADVF